MIVFWFKFYWNLMLTVQLTVSHTGPLDGLTPKGRQVITWTNYSPVIDSYIYIYIYASPGPNRVNDDDWIRVTRPRWVNTLRSRRNRRHFADDNLKCLFLNENVWISIKISLKFVPTVPINNSPSLVQVMAWRLPDDKPLCEPIMDTSLTHICVTRPQWVKGRLYYFSGCDNKWIPSLKHLFRKKT